MNCRCHISECRAKFYLTDKWLIDSSSEGFASLFHDGDETIATAHPLCSSPHLPITMRLFICLTNRSSYAVQKEKNRPSDLFIFFLFYFLFLLFLPCTVSTCSQAGASACPMRHRPVRLCDSAATDRHSQQQLVFKKWNMKVKFNFECTF